MHRRQGQRAGAAARAPSVAHKQTNTPPGSWRPASGGGGGGGGGLSCLGDEERTLREYARALDYINSCHSIVNRMAAQNRDLREHAVPMPGVPNFLDLFAAILSNCPKEMSAQRKENSEEEDEEEDENDRRGATSESETSDFEPNPNYRKTSGAGKFKLKTFKPNETIYEEAAPPELQKKYLKPVPPRKLFPSPPRRYADASSERKVKPRSYSSSVPRTQSNLSDKPNGHDLSGNYSDTALSASENIRQAELTQQEIDKFAKELLGSPPGLPGSSDNNRLSSASEKSTTRPQRKRSPRPPVPAQSGRRYSEILRRNCPSPTNQDAVSKQTSLQKVTHTIEHSQVVMAKSEAGQNKRQKYPANTTNPEQKTIPTAKVSPARSHSAYKEKAGFCPSEIVATDNPYVLQEYVQSQMKKPGSRDKIEERKCNSGSGNVTKPKPKEGFGSARKLSPTEMKLIESQVQLFVEQHVESDDIKTDSDIEEDSVTKDQPEEARFQQQKPYKRKAVRDSEDEEKAVAGAKFPDEHAYSTTADGYQQRGGQRTVLPPPPPSDESSDIKSDEDPYDRRQQPQRAPPPPPAHVHRKGYGYAIRH